ncbi:uncharacterized protein LOC113879862 isoform X2 [Bos indicus x Bos taurus]|uniref:uncharacterized protein LOC113879862 isoform X2 n=1 Tax=Bos indicus x Bos taurus TaxID=30522 RepID=UPI000D538251|nr:uncharacterized protein LOC113879862 isoform X2 [Bos indicus x Bos taurus]XP_027377487.1 uncharacterized protein LOC113879862 isoform X2 [Bos indicus x Bos taurus]
MGAFSSRTHSAGRRETRSSVCLAGFSAPSEMRSTPRPRSARSPATTSPSSPWPPPGLPRSSLFRFRIQADLLHAEKRQGEVFQGSPPRLAGLRPPRDLTARSPRDLSCRRREPNAEREKVRSACALRPYLGVKTGRLMVPRAPPQRVRDFSFSTRGWTAPCRSSPKAVFWPTFSVTKRWIDADNDPLIWCKRRYNFPGRL